MKTHPGYRLATSKEYCSFNIFSKIFCCRIASFICSQILELISLPDISCEIQLFLKSEVTVSNVTQFSDKLIATFFV